MSNVKINMENEDTAPYVKLMNEINDSFKNPPKDELTEDINKISFNDETRMPYGLQWTDHGDYVELIVHMMGSAKGAEVQITPYDISVKISTINPDGSDGLTSYQVLSTRRFFKRIISEESFWSISNNDKYRPGELNNFPLILFVTLAKPNCDHHEIWPSCFEE